MSTFSGFLNGIDHVSVDRFTEFNLRSKIFFLSHCHMDHMIGLNEISPEFGLPGPLYSSEISKVIVQRKYPAIKNIIPLKTGEVIPITIKDVINDAGECNDLRLSVTAIPAGHCPGSVMLLFEQRDKRVLYTGDFRLCHEDVKILTTLKKFHNEIILDSLYVDSTFLSSDYTYFPKQRDSINVIIKLADDWLKMHPNNIVVLRPPASYGYEFLLMEMSKFFQTKIHVSGVTFQDYLYIPEFDSCISNNRLHCGRIHLCATNPLKWQFKQCPCLPDLHERHIRIIRPTAMKWKDLHPTDQFYEEHNDMKNVYYVCYSNHSSCDEIKFLVNYLHPKVIKLNVMPKQSQQREEMHAIVQSMINEYRNNQMEVEEEAEVAEIIECNFNEILSSTRKRSMALPPDEISQLKIKKRPNTLTKI